MEIEYLKMLRDNPAMYPNDIDYKGEIRGVPHTEIEQLEQTWNNGNPFPKALRELLFLAGDFCYLLDYGVADNQQELQEFVREEMADNSKTITKPFYVFDVFGGDTFLFIYLDEGNNPNIHQGKPWESTSIWFKSINQTIKSLVEYRIERVKSDRNPF
jgi:hypothetical protein